MIYLKYGGRTIKKYFLCAGKDIILSTGRYKLDIRNDVLIPSYYWNDDSVSIKDQKLLRFYEDLDVDFGRDDKTIPLFLNRKGTFVRIDGITGDAKIEDLFR